MLDYESQRKLIIVVILGVVLVSILTIVALVFIWLPDKEEETPDFEVGKVTPTISSEENVIERYYKQLYVMFLNNDIDGIYNITGEDYLAYMKMEKSDLQDYLIEKGVLSRNLQLAQYKSYFVIGYTSVYELDLKVKDEAYSINVVIRETSPENYTIAFDMFIDSDDDVYKATLNSVELDIYKRIRFTNSVQYEFKLTNNYDKDIKVNSGGSATAILLVNSRDETRRPIMTTLSTAEFDMEPKEKRSFTVAFPIEDTYDYISFNKLIIKDVEYTGITGTTNLEYNLV